MDLEIKVAANESRMALPLRVKRRSAEPLYEELVLILNGILFLTTCKYIPEPSIFVVIYPAIKLCAQLYKCVLSKTFEQVDFVNNERLCL